MYDTSKFYDVENMKQLVWFMERNLTFKKEHKKSQHKLGFEQKNIGNVQSKDITNKQCIKISKKQILFKYQKLKKDFTYVIYKCNSNIITHYKR